MTLGRCEHILWMINWSYSNLWWLMVSKFWVTRGHTQNYFHILGAPLCAKDFVSPLPGDFCSPHLLHQHWCLSSEFAAFWWQWDSKWFRPLVGSVSRCKWRTKSGTWQRGTVKQFTSRWSSCCSSAALHVQNIGHLMTSKAAGPAQHKGCCHSRQWRQLSCVEKVFFWRR